MTLTVQNPKEIKNGNGSTTVFSFTFVLNQSSDLVVTHTTAAGVETTVTEGTGTTNYSISLPTTPGNGSITYPASLGTQLATGATLTLQRVVDLDQDTDLVNQGAWNPSQVEDALDYSRMVDLEQQDELNRSIKVPVSDPLATTVNLPTKVLRANKAIVFDTNGNVGVSVDNYVDQVTTVAASAASAASSATASAASATAAATSETNAATSYDNFDDRFLGAKSSDPSVNNDGDALITGALYFNSSNNVMMVYTGSAWVRTTPTSSDQTHINTVSGIQANVTTVAGISSNVTTVAGISSNVTSVAGNASNINAVAADATDIGAVAAKATEIGRLGTADAVADMAILGTTDVVADMNTLGHADVVADMNTLGHADVVADMNTLATSDVVADMNTLGTADVVADMNTLGTAAIVEDMNLLGTSDCIADMAILATSDIVTDMNVLGTSANVTAMGILGTSANVTAMSNCSGSISNINTTASNITGVNSFAERYRVSGTAPSSSLDQGDLWFDTANNELKSYGTSWQATSPSAADQANINIVGGELVYEEDLGLITAALTTSSGNNITDVADNIANVNTVAGAIANVNTTATNIANVNLTGGSISNVNTVGGSIADVNRYANEYTIASSAPGSPTEGDLWYDSTNNVLKYYTGSVFASISAGISDVVSDTSPALGGNLDCNNRNLTECGTVSGDNLQIDFGSIA